MMILIKIPVLLFFLTFFTACHFFQNRMDSQRPPLEAAKPEGSSSPDGGRPTSSQPENTQPGHTNVQVSSAQVPLSGQTDSSTPPVLKPSLSKEQLKAFFTAVKRNDPRKVDLALKAGADPTIPDEEGNTALIMAVDKGYTALVIIFLRDRSINTRALNHRNKKGYTALTVSVERDNLEIMALLLEAGADPMHPGPDGYTPLYLTVIYDLVALARRLLEIPQVKASINREEIHYSEKYGEEKEFMFQSIFALICHNKISKGKVTSYGMEMVDLFLKKGADPLVISPDQRVHTALQLAVACTHKPLIQKLLEIPSVKQSVTDTFEGKEAFMLAMISSETVDLFFEAGIDLFTPDEEGNNLLMDLTQVPFPDDNPKCLEHMDLAEHVENESVKNLEKILSIPAVSENINARNKKGETVLLLAVKQSCTLMVDLLLKADADPTIPDGDGNTPLMEVLSGFFDVDSQMEDDRQTNIVRRLLSLDAVKDPAHLNAENQKGETAFSLVEKLLEREPGTPIFLEIRKELLDNRALPPQK